MKPARAGIKWDIPLGLFGLGAGLVALAIALPWISRLLDQRTRKAQAQRVDFEAFHQKSSSAAGPGSQQEYTALIQHLASCERIQRLDLLQRLEWNIYDWRLAQAHLRTTARPRVALVAADDNSILKLGWGDVIPNEHYNLMWPRMSVYGRALRELRRQGAVAVGFDVLFQELLLEPGRAESDQLFARELKAPGTPAVLAIAPKSEPASLFQYRAAMVGDVFATKDADSVARRVRAYTDFRQENPRLGELAERNRLHLTVATDWQSVRVQTNTMDPGQVLPVDAHGCVSLPRNRFTKELVPLMVTNRVWHLGLVLASYPLQVDLTKSGIEGGTLWLRGTNGAVVRRMRVDEDRYFPINWTINIADSLVAKSRIETGRVLPADPARLGSTNFRRTAMNAGGVENLIVHKIEDLIRLDWLRTNAVVDTTNSELTGRVIVVGSTASANNLADRGPTSLDSADFLVGTHLNVANQVLEDEMIFTPDFVWVALWMGVLSLTSCLLTWRLRGVWLPLMIVVLGLAWVGVALWAFASYRIMLPVVHPVVGGLLLPYGAMVSARAIFEQRERQRVRTVFSKLVSPDIVHEILGTGRIQLGGARRELSVLFADVRGFTALTDRYQAEAETYVTEHGLSGATAEAYYEARAREVLETVNLYLGAIADVVKFHQGTLDKYIGDCVMAFWGAPVDNPRHTVLCVIAAIDAQRVVARLNVLRTEENERRTRVNPARQKSGLDPLSPLPILLLGTGVNSGIVTVGLMGSDAHIMNYTVFGREVNLASRLEGVSGHSRVVIGESTYLGLVRFAPQLATLCRPLEPVAVKGFRTPVKVYEVLWHEAESLKADNFVLYQASPQPAFSEIPEPIRGGPTAPASG